MFARQEDPIELKLIYKAISNIIKI